MSEVQKQGGREEREDVEMVHGWRYNRISIATQFWCNENDLINPPICSLPKCDASISPASGPSLPQIPSPFLRIHLPLVRAPELPLGNHPSLTLGLLGSVGLAAVLLEVKHEIQVWPISFLCLWPHYQLLGGQVT